MEIGTFRREKERTSDRRLVRRQSVDAVRSGGPRTGGQCFRVNRRQRPQELKRMQGLKNLVFDFLKTHQFDLSTMIQLIVNSRTTNDKFAVSVGRKFYWKFWAKFSTITNFHLSVTTLQPANWILLASKQFITRNLLENETPEMKYRTGHSI